MKPILSAIAVFFGLTIAASAAEPIPYVDPVHDWRGPYLGLQAGGAWGDTVWRQGASTSGQADFSGALGGYTAGFNWQHSNWVFGIESDTSIADIDASTGANCAPDCVAEINWLSTTRARIGWAHGRFLPFVTAGLAYGEVESGIVGGFGGFDDEDVEFGWAAGGGLEVALNERWSAKIEYLHVDLGEHRSTGAGAPIYADLDDINIVRAGVNYKFDLFGYVFGR